MPFNKQYSVDWELCEWMDLANEISIELKRIKVAIEQGKQQPTFFFLPFDPLKTVGKYC